jgi:hypothetical protein
VAHRHDPPFPPVFTRAQAREAGLTDDQVDRRLATGVWSRERRGVFRVSAAITGERSGVSRAAGTEDDADRGRLAAVLTGTPRRELVASHASAALLYGLPRPLGGWGPPALTAAHGATRARNGARVRVVPLPEADVGAARGLPATTLERTVADCLRSLRAPDGLAIADAAARAGLNSGRLREVIVGQAGWPGVVQARELLDLIDGRRESPLESWSALAFHRWAVPTPQWQVTIRTAGGMFCGRVDAWWPVGLAGEADGRAKYALQAAERRGVDSDGLFQTLHDERSREQSLRRAGADLVRWGARDVLVDQVAGELARQLRVRLARLGRERCFTGVAVSSPLSLARPQTGG